MLPELVSLGQVDIPAESIIYVVFRNLGPVSC